jgi:hypothetical protein
MLELHTHKLCTLVLVPNELLADSPAYLLTPAHLNELEAIAGEPTPDHVVETYSPGDPPECCERCGRADALQDFRGWRHYGDECDWLCGDCYSTARMEE